MQHSPREHPVIPFSTYSTLPELAKCELPEVVIDPDRNLPEALVTYELPSGPLDRLPSSIPPVQDERKAQSRHPWMCLPRRKRNCAFVVVILLVFFGVSIGIVVSIVSRQEVQSRPQTETEKPNLSTSSYTSSSSSTPILPLVPSSTIPSFAFGTPTVFPSPSVDKPLASVCRGTVCPQILTSARLATSLSDRSTTYLFARGRDNAIWYRGINESKLGWSSEWESLGGNFLSQPGALSCEEGRVDVYAVWTEDKSMRTKTFQNGVWSTEWESIHGNSASAPSVCSLNRGNINVVAIDKKDHSVRQKWMVNGREYGPTSQEAEWLNLGGSLSSVSSADIGCIEIIKDVLVRHNLVTYGKGDDGFGIFFKKYNTTVGQWDVEWTQGEGEYRGDPILVSTVEGAHFFGVGIDMAIWFTNWTESGGYSHALRLGGKFQSVVSAVITGSSSRVHVLAVGTDGRLKHKTCIGGTWGTEWEDLGGYFNSSPKAVQVSDRTVVVFGIGPDGTVIHSTFDIGTGYTWGSGQWYTDGGQISTEWYRDELTS